MRRPGLEKLLCDHVGALIQLEIGSGLICNDSRSLRRPFDLLFKTLGDDLLF